MQRPRTNGISETKTDNQRTNSIRFVLRTLSVLNRSTQNELDHIRNPWSYQIPAFNDRQSRKVNLTWNSIRFVQRAPHSEKKFRMWIMNPRKLNQIRSTSDVTRSCKSHIIVCPFESRVGYWVSCGILRPYSREEKVLSCAHWLSTRSSRFAWILCSQNIRVSSPTFNISPKNSEPQ